MSSRRALLRMPIARHDDPTSFLAAAQTVIARDEAEGMMLEARVRALIARPATTPGRVYLATVTRRRVRGVAFQIGDHPVSVGASDAVAVDPFADDLAAEWPTLQGVYGLPAPSERFAQRWLEVTGRAHTIRFRMRHHVLADVSRVSQPRGAARVAQADDLDWLLAAEEAFASEVGIPLSAADRRARIEGGIARGRFWMWDDGAPVSYAGWSPAAPTSGRVAPVYTAPGHRGRGYATALVATMSQALLDSGLLRLSLTTDAANPVSNAIYARIGYRPTSDALHLDFVQD